MIRVSVLPRQDLNRLLCLAVLAVALVVGARQVAAQEPSPGADLEIQQLRVQVLPEFDDPRVLVVVQGRLAAPDTAFPAQVTFRLPQGAQINQMAAMNLATGGTEAQPFDLQPDAADARWSLVTYTLDNAHFFYEYYYDPIQGDEDKAFAFTLSSLQPVGDLTVEVQQPAAATGFALEPAPATSRVDPTFNLTYYQVALGGLAAGEEASISVRYTKADPAPSLSQVQGMGVGSAAGVPGMGGSAAEAPRTSGSAAGDPGMGDTAPAPRPVPVWVWIVALVAVTVLAAVGAYAWYRTQPAPATVPTGAALVSAGGPALFCPQCGTSLKPEAAFCHYCGAHVGARFEQRPWLTEPARNSTSG